MQAQQQPQETLPQHLGVVRLHVNAFYFSTTARRVTSPTWGPPPSCKQALQYLFQFVYIGPVKTLLGEWSVNVMINIVIVKLLSLDKQKCSRDYTLLFVAFDLEERQPTVNTSCSKSGNCPCSGGSCGSYYFVQNFSQYLNNSGVGFQGAIVLETILNYNTTPNSQVFPSGLKPYFTETYNKISQNGFTGDFLALIGRSTYDRRLIDGITNAFEEDGMFL